MNRKGFLTTSLLGMVGLAAGGSVLGASKSKEEEIANTQVGFNHLPSSVETTGNMVIHRADTRGHANHGWLKTYHSFSFANYYDPKRMGFGALRVLNDDTVAGGRGFGTHAHDNMEIISIPLAGGLQHKDSMGNVAVIKAGDIQAMSAGSGIRHSEYNHHTDQEVKFLQIWVFPNKRNVTPRYDQITLREKDIQNTLYQIVSPNPDDAGVWIQQDAWFHLGALASGLKTSYQVKQATNGVYAFVLEGAITINGQSLNRRDGIGIWETPTFEIQATQDAKLLLMDVPMG